MSRRLPFSLRPHQLDSVAAHHQHDTGRTLLVLPPGAGKTAVGAQIALDEGRRTLVLVPNTAIQQQWLDLFAAVTPPISTSDSRQLSAEVTVLTYQALATFDPDADDEAPLVDRLHPNAAPILAALHSGTPWTLILDESHHLLQTWGRLLDEILSAGDQTIVVALTATPQERLTADQAALAHRLFGPVRHEVSTPALVRAGVLAPFRELAWFVTPTPDELAYLADSATRWQELITGLLDPELASTGFLEHLNRTWIERTDSGVPWHRVVKDHSEISRALLRLHSGPDLLPLPAGARLTAADRQDPDVADWVALITDYARTVLIPSTDAGDQQAFQSLRTALPAVGWTLTKNGARPTRSAADKVLTHSAAKAVGAVTLLRAESHYRGSDLRAVVITDFERVTATRSARLNQQQVPGSAWQMLATIDADPQLAELNPLLITGASCAGSRAAMEMLQAYVADRGLTIEPTTVVPGHWQLSGPGWGPRQWVAAATDALLAGGTGILIGTRGLLGEGWDAAALNVLVDATAATTPTAVVQVRGRALRRDPARPDKVAHVHSLVTVVDDHPLGALDYQRFVAKHAGFLAADQQGRITAGVAHVAPMLSDTVAPTADLRGRLNSETITAISQRQTVPALWRIGTPYTDEVVRVAQIVATRAEPDFDVPEPAVAEVGVGPVALGVIGGGLLGWLLADLLGALMLAVLMGVGVAGVQQVRKRRSLRVPPDDVLVAIGSAIAEAMGIGRDVAVAPDGVGVWRVWVPGATENESARFAESLDQVLAPVDNPRYLVSRRLPRAGSRSWHSVPDEFGRNKASAEVFRQAWQRHVSRADLLFTGNPEGAGVLAAVQGLSPLAAESGLVTEWI